MRLLKSPVRPFPQCTFHLAAGRERSALPFSLSASILQMACSADRSPGGCLNTHWGKGQVGVWEASLQGNPLAFPEAAPFPLPGDILALVFGLLFAVTSIAFLLQLKKQHRYLWPCLGIALAYNPEFRYCKGALMRSWLSDFSFFVL